MTRSFGTTRWDRAALTVYPGASALREVDIGAIAGLAPVSEPQAPARMSAPPSQAPASSSLAPALTLEPPTRAPVSL
jgi:hypothetical protein